MSFKPNRVNAPCPALPGVGLLAVEGRDAAAFLQSQSMNDVAALDDGRWHWNGLLTPKGRVIFLFALLRTGPESFLLVSPDADAAEVKAHLQRFLFRSKLVLRDDAGLAAAAGPFAQTDDVSRIIRADDGALALDVSGEGGQRTLWLLPAGHPSLAAADPAATAAWRLADLAHGLPRLSPGQREAWTPQMLSLERLGAFSLKKGCYPGQEIVARTHYLGQAKRTLQRLAGTGTLAESTPVLGDGGRELGRLVCVADAGDGRVEALAVLPAELPAEETLVASTPLSRLPLLGGLAR